jgi:hypothetical protein
MLARNKNSAAQRWWLPDIQCDRHAARQIQALYHHRAASCVKVPQLGLSQPSNLDKLGALADSIPALFLINIASR